MLPAVPPRVEAIRASSVEFHGIVYRARPAQWRDPNDTTGGVIYGGRFNAPGVFSVQYTSLDQAVAVLELLDHTDEQEDHVYLYAQEVTLEGVYDLRSSDVLEAFSAAPDFRVVTLAEIAATTTSTDALQITAAIGATASIVGGSGLLAPSAAWERHAMDPPVIAWRDGVVWPLPQINPCNLVATRPLPDRWNLIREASARLEWPPVP